MTSRKVSIDFNVFSDFDDSEFFDAMETEENFKNGVIDEEIKEKLEIISHARQACRNTDV
ncbi:MAG: hypothetical protein JXR48_16330 [Candidatus Delongbacteria bacterium]|nr:hypothetical protein [Candidatus Delongbacteria bacterium]MBN2836525.1 hypothetical protein [Candidatus Delongbacteria bacterium]